MQIRQLNTSFPLRAYVPLVVGALEDSDGSVRDCARQSAITLFSAKSGVSDAARADLKNEMAKKNVRKGIVEGILSGLMASSTTVSSAASSTHGDHSSEGDGAGTAPTAGASTSRPLNRKPSRTLPRGISQVTQSDASELPEHPPPTTSASTDVPSVFVSDL